MFREQRRDIAKIRSELDALKIVAGQLLTEVQRDGVRDSIADYEFSIFSQWGEDGILQFLTRTIEIEDRSFIEFGVEDFSESNCRYLLEAHNWQGYVIDADAAQISRLKAANLYWQRPINARATFLTKENVHNILDESGFSRTPGVVSVDVDGVDYHLLEALHEWRPAIFVVEYNALFGATLPVTVPYKAHFDRFAEHFSGLYFGASLAAFALLLERRGYTLVGTNSVGNNAFFVRSDLCADKLRAQSVESAFRPSTFRESRDPRGLLTYIDGDARRELIRDLPLVDLRSGETLLVRDL